MVKLKRKYILVELVFAESESRDITTSDVFRAIHDQIAILHGDYGVGCVQASFQVKVHDSSTNIAVLRIGAGDGHRIVSSALPFVVLIGAVSCTLRTIFEGSSMRTVERHLIKVNLNALYARLRSTQLPAEKAQIQEAIISVTGSRVASVRM